ncbi:hypothetical protein SAMN04489713_10731 [Actinomadura madurae]|uniref:Uncharacterized protein n=1 Tax=Actinomadura madurae TaxID=1993 RepID=A0A1I5HZL9_9ACTN|nr:hypothetical protein SAMN04489713_10731 [Actinomadura madurae]SPT58040.1 Uncharacterised protein [Actinomadura madurae]
MPDKQEMIDSRDRSASPVFVDVTGRRRRRLRRLGYAAAAVCGGYSIMIGISLMGGPVSPQTLLPKMVGGGETKVTPSSKHRPPPDDGPGALPPPRPSWPARTPGAPPTAPRASGSTPSGAVPSPSKPDGRRTGPQAPTSSPATPPSRSGGTPPATPPTDSPSPPASPPETGDPAGVDERRDTVEAEPQAAAATPSVAGSDPTAPAAGAQG